MSDKINETISKFGFEVSNKPIGLWLYGEVECVENELTNEKKRIDKMCSVYDIISEKRLGCHLIPGLEIILAECIKYYLQNVNNENDVREYLVELFPKIRANRKKISQPEENKIQLNENNTNEPNKEVINEENIPTQLIEINPTVDYVPIIELSREEGDTLKSIFEKYKIYEKYDENLIKIFDTINDKSLHKNEILSLFDDSKLFGTIIQNYIIKEKIIKIFTDEVNKNAKQIIEDKINSVTSALEKNKFKLLELISLIYAKAGWKSGRLKRVMQDYDINWGTYEDQPYRLHCNAHTDNYTIYPKEKSLNNNKNLLAITDFDLAFFRDNFFNIVNENENDKYGYKDDFLFDSYLNMERQHLEWEFAGLENVIVYNTYQEEMSKDKNFDFLLKGIVSLVRDTSVMYFRKGFLMMDFDLKEKYNELFDNMYDLIDLSLLITHSYIG